MGQNFFLQLILATIVQFWAGLGFYKATLPALRHRTANMDTLITIGTSAAYGFSAVATLFPGLIAQAGIEPMPYFDVSVLVIGLILLGRYFEAKARAIADQLRCPVCRGIPIAESPAELAQNMMQQIREQLQEGKSEEEILSYFSKINPKFSYKSFVEESTDFSPIQNKLIEED